jgi:hypothetical protein
MKNLKSKVFGALCMVVLTASLWDRFVDAVLNILTGDYRG